MKNEVTSNSSDSPSVRLCVLGSGSRGNCIWIECGADAILIDAGFSARRTLRIIHDCGLDEHKVRAVCITHEHIDHTQGVARLQALLKIPVYANSSTARAVKNVPGECWKCFVTGNPFSFGPFTLHPFPLPHDASEPVGYRIDCGGVRIGIATDLGMVTASARAMLCGCRLLVLEANHDEEMLQLSERRWPLKQRILGNRGHLSNRSAAALAADVAGDTLETLILAHLSRDCNREDLAIETVRECLCRNGLDHITVLAAHADAPTSVCLCSGSV